MRESWGESNAKGEQAWVYDYLWHKITCVLLLHAQITKVITQQLISCLQGQDYGVLFPSFILWLGTWSLVIKLYPNMFLWCILEIPPWLVMFNLLDDTCGPTWFYLLSLHKISCIWHRKCSLAQTFISSALSFYSRLWWLLCSWNAVFWILAKLCDSPSGT